MINKQSDEADAYQASAPDMVDESGDAKGKRRKKDGDLDEEYDEEEPEEQVDQENELIDVNRDEEEMEDVDVDQVDAKRRASLEELTKTAPIPPYSSMFIFSPNSK